MSNVWDEITPYNETSWDNGTTYWDVVDGFQTTNWDAQGGNTWSAISEPANTWSTAT